MVPCRRHTAIPASTVADFPPACHPSPMGAKTGYDALMERVCVGLGFCGTIKNRQPLHVDLIIPPSGPVTAEQFAEWVFLADNVNPNSASERWQKLKGQIRAAFIEHMGGEVVDAAELRWSSVS